MAAEAAAPSGSPGTSENLSYILRIGRSLLLGFIRTLWDQYAVSHPQAAPVEHLTQEDASVEQPSGEDVRDSAQVASVQELMLRIWQELSSNSEITSMTERVAGHSPLKVLAEVSEHLFATGINWGRIVVFFYFAYRVIVQSGSRCFDTVVDWTMTFLRNHLAAWIQQQGGWIAMLSWNVFQLEV